MIRYKSPATVLRAGLLLALLLGASGCTEMQLPLIPETTPRTQVTAEISFLNGEFQKAMLEYKEIYETTSSIEDKNSALYGIACTQMILAENDDQLVEAITSLQRWNVSKGSEDFNENRNMLILALIQQSDRIQAKKQQSAAHDKRQKGIIYSQRKKISQMATTVEQLQKQLDELEAIDEIYQEKRKPQ